MLTRNLFSSLLKHLKTKQATVITGMRRTGKTTCLKMLLNNVESNNKVYIDLESISNRLIFEENNYDNIFKQLLLLYNLSEDEKIYLAIDEIQYVKNLPGIVKYLYDNFNIKFLLTGSSSYYIKNLFSESLSGRKKIFVLNTLDFGEFLIFKNITLPESDFLKNKFSKNLYEKLKLLYAEFLEYGGFPDVVLSDNVEEKKDILNDILDSYLMIDIKNFIDFQDASNIYKLIKVISSRVSNKLDYTKIANTLNISKTTVANYIELFESTFFLTRVDVLSNNPDKEIIKRQKLYLNDNGLLNILADVPSGAKFENLIFTQLRTKGDLNYYSLKTGREIDFVFNKNISFEVKETSDTLDLYKLSKLSENLKISKNYMIYLNPNKITLENKNYIWGGDIR